MQTRSSAAADWLLRPGVAVAAVLLAANDWFLKEMYGNWLTGKLSDVAGLYLVAFAALAIIGTASPGLPHRRRSQATVLAITSAALVVVKTSQVGADAYGQLIGWLRFPARLALDPSAGVDAWAVPIGVVVDPTDLIALGVLVLVGVEIGLFSMPRRRGRRALASTTAGQRSSSEAQLAVVRAPAPDPQEVNP